MKDDTPIITHITEEQARKKVKDMNLINGFLFDSVLEDQEDAVKVMQVILTTTFNREIKVLDVTSQKTYNGVDTNLHGIRFDAMITPSKDGRLTATIFDVEMEDRPSDKDELPKRLRYYTSLSDDKYVKTGRSYNTLPDFVTVTISSYDPFGVGDMYYEARTVITTHPHIEYKDGILHIFLYCKGKLNQSLNPEHGKKLSEMLKYILSGEKPLDHNADIETIDTIVTQVKEKSEVTTNFMRQWDREEHIRREAKQEALKEAQQEITSQDALLLIRFGRSHSISDDEIRSQLETGMQLTPQTVTSLFNQVDAEKKSD